MRRGQRRKLGRYRLSGDRRAIRHGHNQYRLRVWGWRRRGWRRRRICFRVRFLTGRQRRVSVPRQRYRNGRIRLLLRLSFLLRGRRNVLTSLSERMKCLKRHRVRMSRLIRHHSQRKNRNVQRSGGNGKRFIHRRHVAFWYEMTRWKLNPYDIHIPSPKL
jgi:hypothetical protein